MDLQSTPTKKGTTVTENTAPETNDNTNSEQTETETPKPDRSTLSEMANMALDRVKPDFDKAFGIAEKLNSQVNVNEMLSEAIEKSEDAEVVKIRKMVEELDKKRLAAVKAMEDKVRPTLDVLSDEDVAKLEAEYKEAASNISTYNSLFELETLRAGKQYTVYDFLGQLPGKRRGAKAGQGEGTKRPRVSKIEITTDVKGEDGWKVVANNEGKSTFGVLAQFIKSATNGGVDLSASDYSDAWVSQNGGKDWQDINDQSTFIVSATDDKDKSHKWNVRVTK